MQDWLNVFGQHDDTGVLGNDTQGMYLATADKSLVVCSIFSAVRCAVHNFLWRQVSILSAGTFFGALLAFPMGDMVGRKWGIVFSCVIFSLGVGLQLDTKWATFVVGRGLHLFLEK
jgi:MFS family permease